MSALKENEIWLDSISGKVSQFNNAMQAMWSDTLDSDMVKGFVALGTEIIKTIDKIGLLNSVLLAFGAFKGFGAIFGVFKDAGISIDFVTQKLGSYLFGINTVAAAETTLTQAQVAQKLTQQGLTDAQAKAIAAQTGLKVSTANLSRETLIASLQAQNYTKEEAEKIATEIFGTTVTEASAGAMLEKAIKSKLASSALVQYAIQMKFATAEEVANMGVTQLLALGFQGLTAAVGSATKAIITFLFTNPVGWIILAIGAIAGGIAIFNRFHKTTEELTEELNELKSELQDIQSEIDSLNSELETTQDRMAELLAMDTLSFTEEEELKRLQKQNDELQREIDLQKTLQKSKQKETERTFKKTMESKLDQKYMKDNWDGLVGTYTKKASGWDVFLGADTTSGEQALQTNIDAYQEKIDYNRELQEKAIEAQQLLDSGEGSLIDRWAAKLEVGAYESNSKSLGKLETSITTKLEEYRTDIEGIEYGDDPEVNAYLDYVNNMLDRWAVTSDGENAKTNALSRIFNKDENAVISDSIDGYVEALKNGDASAKESIYDIINNNAALKEDILATGLSVDEATDYFTSFASEANYETIEGKVKEIEEVTKRVNAAFGRINTATAGSIKHSLSANGWVDEDGNVMSAVIAEYFGDVDGGISEKTRTEIERLVKQLYDGKISVENALKQFEYFGIESAVELYITEVETNFKDVFVELEDVDGLVDTFEELGEAIGSTASALKTFNKAEAEMANSGRVSIETALQLMEYTDDYGSVLQVVDGKLQLVDNAEEVLIQTRINAIKTSAEASLADAENAYSKAKLATQTYQEALNTDMSASVVASAWEKVLAAGAGLFAGIKSLVTGETWTDAYNRVYDETLSNVTGYETTYDDAGLQALVDAENKAKDAVSAASDRVELANQLTSETLESINDADDVDTKDEARDDAFQREMDYWENQIQANQAKYTQIQNEIDLLEAKGKRAGADYYKEQIKLEEERLGLLKQQQEQVRIRLQSLESEKGSEAWWEAAHTFNDLEDEIDGAILSIQELNNAIVEGSHGFVDDIQDVYDTLVEAQKEYEEGGRLSVDTMQSLLELEPKYLDLLVDENGNLNLNKEALQEVARARIEDLSIKRQQAILDEALKLATDGSRQAILQQIAVLETATQVGADWVNVQMQAVTAAIAAKVATGELTKAEGDAFISGTMSQIQAVKSVADASLKDLDKTLSNSGEDDAFQKTMDYWENRIQANQAKYEQIQNEIDLLESQGMRAGDEYYNQQLELEQQRLDLLQNQRDAAAAHLATLREGSDEWWEVAHTLNDIEGELDDVAASMVDIQDAAAEAKWYLFEEFNNRLDDTIGKLGTIRDLIAPDGSEDWFDDEGQWTEDGVAVLGTYVQELELYKNGLKETREELEKYNDTYSANTEDYYAKLGIHSEQEYYDKVQELTEQQYDYTKSISDTEQSVVDMYESNIDAVEEYTQTLVDSYNDYIDSVKEALDAERDLYDFKKNVQKQSKDIASLERRIASLSGSTNAGDIAERRKLEAELYEGREALNDTYYDHARSAQDEALDAEQSAYEETMIKFIDNLRTGLEAAIMNMDEFLMSVTSMVTLNADTVLTKYQETELPLSDAITNPWEAAKTAVGAYSENALDLMNQWTQEGFFDVYKASVGDGLSSPWDVGVNAANGFGEKVTSVMLKVSSDIASNVESASEKITDLFGQIKDTESGLADVTKSVNNVVSDIKYQVGQAQSEIDKLNTNIKTTQDKHVEQDQYESDPPKNPGKQTQQPSAAIKAIQTYLNKYFDESLAITGLWDANTVLAVKRAQGKAKTAVNGRWDKKTVEAIKNYWTDKIHGLRTQSSGSSMFGQAQRIYTEAHKATPLAYHAKGTTGTTRDEWAITDESQFGDELVLVPGKDGNLSFMRKGTGVVPADLTQKLFELAQIPASDLMNKNLTAIVPNITKNDFKNEFNFESLVHVDTVDSDTLPKLEKMVDKKIDDFSRALNYSLKKFTR